MGWGDIVSRAGQNYTKIVNTNAIGFESTDFWHRLNATRQIKCTSVHYVAFNLPTVAFPLSGDPIFYNRLTLILRFERGKKSIFRAFASFAAVRNEKFNPHAAPL